MMTTKSYDMATPLVPKSCLLRLPLAKVARCSNGAKPVEARPQPGTARLASGRDGRLRTPGVTCTFVSSSATAGLIVFGHPSRFRVPRVSGPLLLPTWAARGAALAQIPAGALDPQHGGVAAPAGCDDRPGCDRRCGRAQRARPR